MKTPFTALVALLAVSSAASAAPRLVVSTPALAPESQIDVVFDSSVAATADLGKTADPGWLDIQPALPGKLLWKAQNVIGFTPSQPPAIGATYTFSVPKNHVHLDKSAVPDGKFATVASEPFRIVSSNPQDRWSSGYSPSNGAWIVIFNDDIDPAAAANFFSFVSDTPRPATEGPRRVAARLERATMEQAGYYGRNYKPWADRFPDAPAVEKAPDASLGYAIVVTPAVPLAPGYRWSLAALKDMPNSTASARTAEESSYDVGKVEPFKATAIDPLVAADEPRSIVIRFNQPLLETLPVDFLAKCVSISPRPENLTAKIDGREILLTGNLADADDYRMTFQGPFVSKGGLDLEAPLNKEVKFERLDPELILPSGNEAQLANGSRGYRVRTVNLASLHVRVKHLAGADLVRAYQGYRSYTGVGHDGANIEPTAPLPYAMVVGETVFEKDIPLGNAVDTSKEVTLKWDEILPQHLRTAALFLDITGTANPASGVDGRRNAQALLQLTDIGLAWKTTAGEALVYAFSCDTGAPLPGVKIDLYGEDAATLASARTDAAGLVTLARSGDIRHLHASLAADSYLTAFDATLGSVGLWHFPVRYSYDKSTEPVRQAFLFTDRTLYRPGETVRLKGIVRNRDGNAILAASPGKARVVVIDPEDKEVHSSPVEISAAGSFDFTYTLPAGRTGEHTIRLEYPAEIELAATLEEHWEKQEAVLASARFAIPLYVEEFRRNAFEVTQMIAPPAIGATSIATALAAKYYQGQPVAAGQVKYFSRVTPRNPYPERFREYLFGNHRTDDWAYWYHYFGYRSDEGGSAFQATQLQGEARLSPDGSVEFATEIPQADFPTARDVVVASEVTDSNNQTLSATTTATVHPASVYVGVSRVDRLVRAGDAVALKLVAAGVDGEPFPGSVKVTATLTREVNSAVKTRTDEGATTTRNDVSEETVVTSELTIDPAASAGQGADFTVTPRSTGLHHLTVRGTDPAGHPFATVTYFNVYGTNEYPWLYEDGLRVKLVAGKKSYKPGETARVLVLSPIEGTALVTIEREKVLRSFQVALKADHPVIDIPLTADDAPNAFVSVLIVKGAKESAREHKEPQLRLGYCELIVEDLRDRLAVGIQAAAPGSGVETISTGGAKPAASFRPGDEVTLTGTVALADGSPAAGAEVTVYAEDEGTLAVMGYETPLPMDFFHAPRTLDVETGTSFETFISEDPEQQYFSNKGFFIGGGADMTKLADLLRKNFDPCATWAPALVADGEGKFTHTFKLPDTLTRYRLIAVAHHGLARFGQVESSLLVKKDLMLEPKSPRFANQSDTFDTRVLVQNASEHEGTWEIKFSTGSGPETPCATATGTTSEMVTLAAGASASVVFPVRAEATGEAVLTWHAVPVSLRNAALTPALAHRLSDSVETRFPVEYPMPLLRQSKLVTLGKAGARVDLRDRLDSRLLDGAGDIELEFSRSPLVEAAGSVDFLLHYPYGCVEQTTSSLIPWLAVEPLKPVIPKFAALDETKVAAAIQAGADRLLSMQLPDGSFAYWPGSTDTVPWATSYAGLGLIMAASKGANVPAAAIDSLKENLIASLRGVAGEKSPYAMEINARTLLILALGGSPQPAYRNVMVDRIASLTPSARFLLATAICAEEKENPANLALARSVLTSNKPFKSKDDNWMPWTAGDAFRLIAWLAVEPDGPEPAKALDRMFRERNPYGQWRTTWVNGWSLLAMAAYAEHEKLDTAPVNVSLETAAGIETITLAADRPTASRSFKLAPGMRLAVAADRAASIRANLAAKPRIEPIQPVATNGLSIERFYERVDSNGTPAVLTEPKVGDLVRVSLRVTLPKDDTRYLVIDDPLPALFETVNSDFKTQRAAAGIATSQNDWHVSHSELRTDRASFFLDEIPRRGTYTLTYLARCTSAGQATAPPAKVEAMYDPENFALSASRVFTAE